ncbi:MAG: PilZ domain-containing protein [Bacteriovoracaceae bacterium]|nr:PilZ domain-containing protein [Bacteriovoracaceae bacterium]
MIWLGPESKELVSANKETVLEYLVAGKILFNDHLYILEKRMWSPIFKITEFEKHSFPFHEKTPFAPDWHPPPIPKFNLVSRAERAEKSEDLIEQNIGVNDELKDILRGYNREFSSLAEKDEIKWSVLEKRMNWFEQKLGEYTDRKLFMESVEKEKLTLLKDQIKTSNKKVTASDHRYSELENKFNDLQDSLNEKLKEIGRLKIIENEYIKTKEKANCFLEELSEVKYKMKQRESLHQDSFIQDSLEKLYGDVENRLIKKIEDTSDLNVNALSKIEDFHKLILEIENGQVDRDEKFEGVIDLVSKQSKIVSDLLERREALDKRIVEKVEDGVNGLSKEQKDLTRKVKLVIEDFKNLEQTISYSSLGNGDNKSKQIELVKKWQNYSKELEYEISTLKTKLNQRLTVPQADRKRNTVDNSVEYENILIDKQKSEKQVKKLTLVATSQESKINKLASQNSKLKNNLTDIAEKYNAVVRKLKSVDSESSDAEEIRLKFEEEQERTKSMQINLKNLQEELEKLNDDYDDLKQEKEDSDQESTKAHQLIEELKVYKEAQNEYERKELHRLVGDSFEISNEETWYMKVGDIVTGPHKFSELYYQKEDGEIDRRNTYLKSEESGKWKTMGEYTEFCVPIQEHSYEENGVRLTKYFIKRGSYRAPFYEIVLLEVGEEEYKGYCTSLSSGGIFIELNKIDENVLKQDTLGKVFFKQGALSESFSCEVQIKNIADKRPRGVGLMFVNLGQNDKKIIGDYVAQYMNQSQSKLAS